MDRYDFYFRQPVAESEMDAAFDGVEQAMWDLVVDTDLVGVLANAVVTEHTPNNLTVDVSGSAAIHDKAGQRIAFGPVQTVDLSVDYLSVSTDVGTPGNEKIVSVFAKFDRSLTDPRVDGNSLTVYWNRAETFGFHVKQGSEGGAPATPPALESEYILLADVRRSFGDTTIDNADITGPTGTYVGHSDRREDVFDISAGSFALRAGTPEEIAQDLLTEINGHVTDAAAAHNATAIELTALSATWENGDSIVAVEVDAAFEEIVTELAAKVSAANCGADRVGAFTHIGVGTTLPTGSVMEQLVWLADKCGGLATANTWTLANTMLSLSLTATVDQIIGPPGNDFELKATSGNALNLKVNTADKLALTAAGGTFGSAVTDIFTMAGILKLAVGARREYRVERATVTTGDVEVRKPGDLSDSIWVTNTGADGPHAVIVQVEAATRTGERVRVSFIAPHGTHVVDVVSEGASDVYNSDPTPTLTPDWVDLEFDETLTGSNPNGEWIVVGHGRTT